MTRKFGTIDGRGTVSIGIGPIPQPNAGELLVEVYASLISPGTELGGISRVRNNPDPSRGPQPFGYQNAGIVISKGARCDEFKIGSRVACMGWGYALHTTHACVPKNLCVPIPDRVSYEAAAFNHLAATALNAVRRAELQFGVNVVVAGLGIVGQLIGQFARLSGAHVMGMDRLPLRVKIAAKNSVDIAVCIDQEDSLQVARKFTNEYGMDVGFIAFGGDATETLAKMVQMMKSAPDTPQVGCIVLVGECYIKHFVPLGNVDIRGVSQTGPGYHDPNYERGADYTPVFVRWTTKNNLEEVIRAIDQGRLKVEPLITHRFSLDEIAKACEKLIEAPHEALGVILNPRD